MDVLLTVARDATGVPLAAASPAEAFADYFRCPAGVAAGIEAANTLSREEGYFAFGGAVCYGRRHGDQPSPYVTERLADLTGGVVSAGGATVLPFDLSQVVRNLRHERYRQAPAGYAERLFSAPAVRQLYYLLRPLLKVPVRRRLQRARLNGWDRIQFPRWPVDCSVDTLMQSVMALLLARGGTIPFIWFWPDGAHGGAMVTHDVEGEAGGQFCGQLMDIDDAFGVKAAFQVIPMGDLFDRLADGLRARGFELNLHDFNHDGRLFDNRREFLWRAARINAYARQFDCEGFRSGAMYRRQQWYDAFEFSYDMSVPNPAHLEPQRGGCCTVMPFFVGRILELPLTTLQDYSLFHILGDYSIDLWRRQIEKVLSYNGLVTLLAHPDYLIDRRARAVYEEVLAHLSRLRDERRVWVALPGEINRWWRNRAAMSLVRAGRTWRVVGPGSERARVAWATLDRDQLVYTLDDAA